MPFLELRNVNKGYGVNGARAEVLADINLAVEEGEFVAIVGYSGAGKTTLISMIAGLAAPDGGDVLMEGRPITAPGPERAVVFQNYSLLPWMTVEQNVALAVDQAFAKEPPAARRARVARALAMVNLTPAAAKKPGELSGGMRQRVSVARALSMDPRVLLLDEPLGALDALTRATIQDEITQIWARDRKTVVLITNDVDEAILLADRIVPLSAGPSATLGPSMAVEIPRPRDRKAMNHDPRFKAVRRRVIEWLLGEGSAARRAPRRLAGERPRRGAASAERPTLTVGFLPLTDCAPLVVACEREVFHRHEIDVQLQKFPSWDAITDALCTGKIQAAHLPGSIPVAVNAGLMGHRRPPLVVPWVINRNGQAITLSRELLATVGHDPAALRGAADRARERGVPLAFASTHRFGTHALWLRYWLAAAGIDPDADVSLAVCPPPLLIAGLRQGEFSGFCGGEPWNAKAVGDGTGYTAVTSQEIWPGHPEKVLALTEAFAAEQPDVLRRLLSAMHDASQWLDDPINRAEAASLMARPAYLNVRVEEILPRLGGDYDRGDGRPASHAVEHVRFFSSHVNYPRPKHAAWFLTQFRRWGLLAGTPDYRGLAERTFRADLYQSFANSIGFAHGGRSDRPERLFDGTVFDPSRDPEAYALGFAINHPAEPAPHGAGRGAYDGAELQAAAAV
jgi:nitrate/nitrite transport system ATP-binding protein